MVCKSILAWPLFASVLLAPGLLGAASFYTTRLDDPAVVYLSQPEFPVRATGSRTTPTPSSRPSTRSECPARTPASAGSKKGCVADNAALDRP